MDGRIPVCPLKIRWMRYFTFPRIMLNFRDTVFGKQDLDIFVSKEFFTSDLLNYLRYGKLFIN